MPNSTRDTADRALPVEGSVLRPMGASDVPQVVAIERGAFASPWRADHFLHEIRDNPFATNRVVEHAGRVVAYACVWIVDEEMKINNFAVHEDFRRRGLGAALLEAMLRKARRSGCRVATLEVRPSNLAALWLYRRHGFVEVARRKNYYAVEGEDAIVMCVPLGG
jgi:ribosomal-protein-alanine N-acetyltransferase